MFWGVATPGVKDHFILPTAVVSVGGNGQVRCCQTICFDAVSVVAYLKYCKAYTEFIIHAYKYCVLFPSAKCLSLL